MIGVRAGVAVLVGTLALAGCGGRSGSPTNGPPALQALGSAARLRTLLAAAQVPVGRGKHPTGASFTRALTAFERFAAIPVDPHDLSRDRPNDDLLFEFGVFESTFWGSTFELELTRQYALANGDLHQVHLVVHFLAPEFTPVTRALRATTCLPGAGCAFGCFFANEQALVPHSCKVVPQGAGGYRVRDMTLWASETGGRDQAEQRTRWIRDVRSFAVVRSLLARHFRPRGYEVWQGSAE